MRDEKQMFRKRHVHIGPADLTIAPGDAVSFYGKDGRVHGVLGACVADQLIPTLLKSGACSG
jgi:plastocyanin